MTVQLSDRQVTVASKAFAAALVVTTAAATVGMVATNGFEGVVKGIPTLYVTSVVFVGVWIDQLTTERFNRALVVGLLALLASLWDATAPFAPLLVLPGIVILLWPAVVGES